MKKLSRNSFGFSAVEALIILVVVALLAFAGWFVYHKQQEKNDKKTTTSSSSNKTDTSKSDSKDASKNSTTQESFTVTEWSVEAPYTASDRFTYKLSDDKKLLTAISKDLAAADTACSTFGAGQIARYAAGDYFTADGSAGPTAEQTAAQNPSALTKVGNYYYQFRHSQSACGSVSVADQNKANDQLKALVQNLKATN